jgi:two-component system response regulator LytT
MKIVIVEDEPLVLSRIKRLTIEILESHESKISCFNNIDDAEQFLSENSTDLLLLDLNLMGSSGFELLKKNVAAAYHTIVISAYSEKAILAFEYGVIDFVAKPFTSERLEKAFDRFLDSSQRTYYGCRYLSIKKSGGLELISIADIDYIQAEGHYSLIHLKGETKSTALHSKNIEKIMQLLPNTFLRVHRSYIANMGVVKKLIIKEGSRYSLILQSGHELPIGRTKYQNVKQFLESGNS